MDWINSFQHKSIIKSPWLLHYDAGCCNGCDIEVLATLTPVYDVERFGIINIGDPKQADIFVVTGPVNYRNQRVLKTLFHQMPDPKIVVAVGTCACTGGVFHNCYNILGGVDKVLPVDVYIPGCAVRPESIIEGIILGLEKLSKTTKERFKKELIFKQLEEEKEKQQELIEEFKSQESTYLKLKAQLEEQKLKEQELLKELERKQKGEQDAGR
jgi:ech hydrogenase subunit C